MNVIITQLVTYPIKGMGGIQLETAKLTPTGIQWDRAFMLVDESGLFISQRSKPELALFRLEISGQGIEVTFRGSSLQIIPEIDFAAANSITARLFQEQLLVDKCDSRVNDWFSNALNEQVYLVRPARKRFVKNHPGFEINFPDASQYLILGEGSLELLNQKLEDKLLMNRFRPNIVFSGGAPHVEDTFESVQIGGAHFEFVKPCGRCKVPTIEQESGIMGLEPVQTLSKYRMIGKSILFGAYLKWIDGTSEIRVGAPLTHT